MINSIQLSPFGSSRNTHENEIALSKLNQGTQVYLHQKILSPKYH